MRARRRARCLRHREDRTRHPQWVAVELPRGNCAGTTAESRIYSQPMRKIGNRGTRYLFPPADGGHSLPRPGLQIEVERVCDDGHSMCKNRTSAQPGRRYLLPGPGHSRSDTATGTDAPPQSPAANSVVFCTYEVPKALWKKCCQ